MVREAVGGTAIAVLNCMRGEDPCLLAVSHDRRPQAGQRGDAMAKGQMKSGKSNKPKLSQKAKQAKRKEKRAKKSQ